MFSIQIHEYLSSVDIRDWLLIPAVCVGCLREAAVPVMATRFDLQRNPEFSVKKD